MPAQLPFGQVIATCQLIGVVRSDDLIHIVSPTEERYGIYDPGRFGWILTDIRPLAHPFDYKGGQGFFNVPDELIGAAR